MEAVVVHEIISFSWSKLSKIKFGIIINFLLDCGHIANTRKDPPVGRQHLLAKTKPRKEGITHWIARTHFASHGREETPISMER